MHIVEVRPQKPPSPLRPILRGGNTGEGGEQRLDGIRAENSHSVPFLALWDG